MFYEIFMHILKGNVYMLNILDNKYIHNNKNIADEVIKTKKHCHMYLIIKITYRNQKPKLKCQMDITQVLYFI